MPESNPGASAWKEAQRRRANGNYAPRRILVRADGLWGRLMVAFGLRKPVYREKVIYPAYDPGASWQKGAQGEMQIGDLLNWLASTGLVFALHDRKIPGSRANFDHILICTHGVYVVDVKNYSYPARVYGDSLHIGRYSRDDLIQKGRRQADMLKRVLLSRPHTENITPYTILCFMNGESMPGACVNGVYVLNLYDLVAFANHPGSLSRSEMEAIHARLQHALKPAVQS